ncbi:MAG TPA: cation-translocating P-type ATPase C-terminal domain-containing protein, partial [Nitrospira sp.]|nr:cation-translocating P-type ATPase C-terminal domain-containing protein [Nitrospira sp.]
GITTNRMLVAAVLISALLQAGILLSPWGQDIFRVVPLRLDDWWLVAACGMLPFVVMELWKAWSRVRNGAARTSTA